MDDGFYVNIFVPSVCLIITELLSKTSDSLATWPSPKQRNLFASFGKTSQKIDIIQLNFKLVTTNNETLVLYIPHVHQPC